MISGSEEKSWITLPSPPTSSPKEFEPWGAFGIYLRSVAPSSLADSRNLSEEGGTLLPPLEVSSMTSFPANVLYLTCVPLYSELYIKLLTASKLIRSQPTTTRSACKCLKDFFRPFSLLPQ